MYCHHIPPAKRHDFNVFHLSFGTPFSKTFFWQSLHEKEVRSQGCCGRIMLAFPIPLGTGQLCIQQQPQIDVRDGLAQSRACVHSASQVIGQSVLRYCVSILMPLYNEEEFVATAIARVLQAPLPAGMDRELIVVDDGSTDGLAEIVTSIAREHPGVIRLIRHPQNRGKGQPFALLFTMRRESFVSSKMRTLSTIQKSI